MRDKILLGIIGVFLLGIIISTKIYATSEFIDIKESTTLNIGDTYTYNVGNFITSTRIDDESIISYERDGSFKRKITARKKGKTNIYFTYSGGTTTLTVTVKDPIEEAQKEIDNTDNAYKTEPGENADAKTIKNFVISDQKYNNGNALKEVSKDKLNKWLTTVNNYIATDRAHYGQPGQYGRS